MINKWTSAQKSNNGTTPSTRKKCRPLSSAFFLCSATIVVLWAVKAGSSREVIGLLLWRAIATLQQLVWHRFLSTLASTVWSTGSQRVQIERGAVLGSNSPWIWVGFPEIWTLHCLFFGMSGSVVNEKTQAQQPSICASIVGSFPPKHASIHTIVRWGVGKRCLGRDSLDRFSSGWVMGTHQKINVERPSISQLLSSFPLIQPVNSLELAARVPKVPRHSKMRMVLDSPAWTVAAVALGWWVNLWIAHGHGRRRSSATQGSET